MKIDGLVRQLEGAFQMHGRAGHAEGKGGKIQDPVRQSEMSSHVGRGVGRTEISGLPSSPPAQLGDFTFHLPVGSASRAGPVFTWSAMNRPSRPAILVTSPRQTIFEAPNCAVTGCKYVSPLVP